MKLAKQNYKSKHLFDGEDMKFMTRGSPISNHVSHLNPGMDPAVFQNTSQQHQQKPASYR